MAAMYEVTNWKDNFKSLKTHHDQAYAKIDEGISSEHSNQVDNAIQKYDEGLLLIDKALAVPIDCPSNPEPTWERACKMVEQMKRTRKEILSRLSDIQAARNANRPLQKSEPDGPPTYDEAIALCSSTSPAVVNTSNITPNISSSNSNQPTHQPYQPHSSNFRSSHVISDSNKLYPDVPTLSTTSGSFQSVSHVENFTKDQTNNPTSTNQTDSSIPKREITVSELGKALESVQNEIENKSAIEIFTCNNVVVCSVFQNGEITTSSQTEFLKIFVTEDENSPKYYLQVGTWRYPLIRGISPCIRTRYGAFFFPDTQTYVEGKSIGLIVPEDCVEPIAAMLEDILNVEIQYGAHPGTRPPSDLPETISQHIISGGNFISNALIKGAEKVEQCLNYGTPRVIEKISPNAEPTQLPSKLKKTVKVTKNVSESAAKTTGYIANKVSSATVGLGKFLSPHIYKGSTSLLTKYYGYQEQDANQTVDNVMTVASGAVQSIGAIYSGLEVSGAILGKSLTDNTVQIVKHKYGQPAGEFTEDTFHTVGNVIEVNTNVRSLATKRLIKNTVKQTGKQVVLEAGSKSSDALESPKKKDGKK